MLSIFRIKCGAEASAVGLPLSRIPILWMGRWARSRCCICISRETNLKVFGITDRSLHPVRACVCVCMCARERWWFSCMWGYFVCGTRLNYCGSQPPPGGRVLMNSPGFYSSVVTATTHYLAITTARRHARGNMKVLIFNDDGKKTDTLCITLDYTCFWFI